jgi:hypothetical protein
MTANETQAEPRYCEDRHLPEGTIKRGPVIRGRSNVTGWAPPAWRFQLDLDSRRSGVLTPPPFSEGRGFSASVVITKDESC